MATIFETFASSAERHPGRLAIGFIQDREIVRWSYAELLAKIQAMAKGLAELPLSKGDRVALISLNDPLWPVVDLAIAKLGLVLVPIHTTLTVEQILKILLQSQAKALVLGPGSEGKLSHLASGLPAELKTVIFIENQGHEEYPLPGRRAFTVGDLLKKGEAHSGELAPISLDGNDLATIIFTSGTTGEMKGVLLSHQGLIDSGLNGNALVGAAKEEVLLSVLPLSHAFERTAGLLAPLFYGSEIDYGGGIFELVKDLETFHPIRINAVPRLLEKMKEGLEGAMKKKGKRLYRLFFWCLFHSGEYRRKQSAGQSPGLSNALAHRLGEFLFYKKIRKKFGGRLLKVICGGAPMDPEIIEFFEALGIQVLQGYGLTEVSPIVTVNPYWKNKIGSVGLPLKCIELKIGAKEEILVKGSSLMLGYDSEAATREAIDAQGWFHTGDQGEIDSEGYLFIKGRVKEMIVTSYGKNVFPSWVEQTLEKSPLIQQAAIVGHGKAFLVALFVLNRENVLEKLSAGKRGLPWEQLCEAPELRTLVAEELARVQKPLPPHEQIKKFKVLPEEFSMANDLLTPTLKLKRKKISDRFTKEIGEMFN